MNMNRQAYQILYYVPDLVSGARVPIGARVCDGPLEVLVESRHIPGPRCLGGDASALALEILLERLRSADIFDRSIFGQHLDVAEMVSLPSGVSDAPAWVLEHVLPAAYEGREPSEQRKPETRLPKLATQFFANHHVDRWVKRAFQPRTDMGGWLADAADSLEPVTHWVPHPTTALLLEPLSASRRDVGHDIARVTSLFAKYKVAIDALKNGKSARCLAYILPGGSTAERDRILANVGLFAHEVHDTNDADGQLGFLRRIREHGEESEALIGTPLGV